MVYLCTVIDLSEKFDLSGSIIHSDQDVHYTSLMYVDLLEELNVKQSMSRKGNCWDNAKAESFFGYFKSETLHLMRRRIKDINEIIEIVEDYMDHYIYDRPQKKLGSYPPGIFKKKQLSV